MTSVTHTILLLALVGLQHAAEAFFMPSFSSSYIKKSEPSLPMPMKQWPMAPSAALYYGQPYSLDQATAPQTSMPVAVSVPVALHAPAPAPPPQAPIAPALPPQFASFGSGGLFHTMQLVPCLCSVPKDPNEPPAAPQEQRDPQHGNSANTSGNGPRT